MADTEQGIQPALTPEEWAGVADLDPRADDGWENAWAEQVGRHAAAARALHGQPFGFIWADVDRLRGVADGILLNAADSQIPDKAYAMRQVATGLHDLADRIAALLPPREGV